MITSSPTNVVMKHGLADGDDAVRKAELHCQSHGKHAVLDRMQCPATCISQFRCE